METKEGSADKLVEVEEYRTADTKGNQPVIIHKNLHELMLTYYNNWRSDPEDDVEELYFSLNTRRRNMHLTRV